MKKTVLGHVLAIVTVVIWGTTFIASKFLLEVLTPVQIMVLRFLIAYAVLWVLYPHWSKLVLRDELLFFGLGLFGCTLYFLAENYALTYTLTSNVAILLAFAPILTSLLVHLFTRDERMTGRTVLGFAIAVSGVALVVFNGTVILKLNPRGDILAFLAALMWAVYSLLLKRASGRFHPVLVARKVMFYGLVTALPYLLIVSPHIDFAGIFNLRGVICLLFLGILGSGLCYVAWNRAVRIIGVVRANNYIYADPFIAMVAGAILLKEPVTVMAIVGSVLIILGVVVSSRGTSRLAE